MLNTGCNDWLDVLPKNEQVAPDYWKTKEQVAEVLAQGYSYMRNTVPSLIYWENFVEVPFTHTVVQTGQKLRFPAGCSSSCANGPLSVKY